MKKILFLISAVLFGVCANAQSISLYQGKNEIQNFAPTDIDSIVFKADAPTGTLSDARKIDATWCSIGTSITWYNNNVSTGGGRFTRGYQDRVMDKLAFKQLINGGDNGGTAERNYSKKSTLIKKADYYTIEHGINDWGNSVPVGTLEDYINGADNGTFASAMRKIVNYIFRLNPKAKVVLCTPRKGFGFGGYLPDHWYDAKNGIYLKEYADLVRQIASYESFPVADFFNECGGQTTLPHLSIDSALHPNDAGYQMMANVLIKAFEKILVN
ncbi:MAG: SGNH/GDSL hydrolase family protein [Muribaculaceae bacterium]|nr:SGNH/GDSL hydrolase family protein [Muribaculaceae bacterium]